MRDDATVQIARTPDAQRFCLVAEETLVGDEEDIAGIRITRLIGAAEVEPLELGDSPRIGGEHDLLVWSQPATKTSNVDDYNTANHVGNGAILFAALRPPDTIDRIIPLRSFGRSYRVIVEVHVAVGLRP